TLVELRVHRTGEFPDRGVGGGSGLFRRGRTLKTSRSTFSSVARRRSSSWYGQAVLFPGRDDRRIRRLVSRRENRIHDRVHAQHGGHRGRHLLRATNRAELRRVVDNRKGRALSSAPFFLLRQPSIRPIAGPSSPD